MYCGNCGKQLKEGASFCSSCGWKLEDSGYSPPNRKKKKGQKRKNPSGRRRGLNNKKRLLFIGGAIVIVAIIFLLVSSIFKRQINLNKYMTITVSGYDTIGTATVEFDVEKFSKDYGSALAKKSGGKSSGKKSLFDDPTEEYNRAARDFLDKCVSGSLDKDRGLSNGDTITYKWSCDDQLAKDTYGYKLKYKNIEKKVSKLQEAKSFDPFEGVKVICDGISPHGRAEISREDQNSEYGDLYYTLDKDSDLKNGDKITLILGSEGDDIATYCVDRYGMIPSPMEKTFVVDGLNSYVRSPNEVSQDSLAAMKKQAESVFNAMAVNDFGDGEQLRGLNYVGSYLLVNKNSDSDSSYDQNRLYLVYKAQVANYYTSWDQKTYNKTNDIYWYLMYENLLVDNNGVTTVDISDYRTPGNNFRIDSGIGGYWYYDGYPTLDEFYNHEVVGNGDKFDYIEGESGGGKQPSSGDESTGQPDTKEPDTEEPTTKQPKQDTSEQGIIFPDSSKKVISKDKIKALSDEELKYAINEIYARNGYIFESPTLQKHYEQYDWYEGKHDKNSFSESVFNDVELKNLTNLTKERDGRK